MSCFGIYLLNFQEYILVYILNLSNLIAHSCHYKDDFFKSRSWGHIAFRLPIVLNLSSADFCFLS